MIRSLLFFGLVPFSRFTLSNVEVPRINGIAHYKPLRIKDFDEKKMTSSRNFLKKFQKFWNLVAFIFQACYRCSCQLGRTAKKII
jgi:hypothetical protein